MDMGKQVLERSEVTSALDRRALLLGTVTYILVGNDWYEVGNELWQQGPLGRDVAEWLL